MLPPLVNPRCRARPGGRPLPGLTAAAAAEPPRPPLPAPQPPCHPQGERDRLRLRSAAATVARHPSATQPRGPEMSLQPPGAPPHPQSNSNKAVAAVGAPSLLRVSPPAAAAGWTTAGRASCTRPRSPPHPGQLLPMGGRCLQPGPPHRRLARPRGWGCGSGSGRPRRRRGSGRGRCWGTWPAGTPAPGTVRGVQSSTTIWPYAVIHRHMNPC